MKRRSLRAAAVMLAAALVYVALSAGCGIEEKKSSYELTDMPDVLADSGKDIDLDALNEAADSIKDLDLVTDAAGKGSTDSKAAEAEEESPEDTIPRIAEEISYINVPAGDVPNVQIDGYRTDATEGIRWRSPISGSHIPKCCRRSKSLISLYDIERP